MVASVSHWVRCCVHHPFDLDRPNDKLTGNCGEGKAASAGARVERRVRGLPIIEQLGDREPDVLGDLAQKSGRVAHDLRDGDGLNSNKL